MNHIAKLLNSGLILVTVVSDAVSEWARTQGPSVVNSLAQARNEFLMAAVEEGVPSTLQAMVVSVKTTGKRLGALGEAVSDTLGVSDEVE